MSIIVHQLIYFYFDYRGILRSNSFWDKLVFRKVQEGMGGRLRLMIVGSAPLAANVLTFTRCALGCLVSHFFSTKADKFFVNTFFVWKSIFFFIAEKNKFTNCSLIVNFN